MYKFTPNPGLVNEAIAGGLQNAKTIMDIARTRRRQSRLSDLADLVRGGITTPEQHNAVGASLAELGLEAEGVRLSQAPEKRLFEQAEFDALQNQRNIQNQIGLGNLEVRRNELNARLNPTSPFNTKPPTPLSGIGKFNEDYDKGFITADQRDAAIAKANTPKNGIEITNPDGTVTRIGGTVSNGLGKAGINQLEKSSISNIELLELTDSVRQTFKPEFLTYLGQGEQFFTAQAEKLGMAPPEARRQFVRERTQFVTQVERLFNAYRKEITGAAAAVQELDRLKKSFLNTDQSPTEFEATLDSYQEELRRTLRLRNRVLREGLNPRSPQGGDRLDVLFLTSADDDIEARGQELMAQGMDEQQVLEILDREGY